MGVRVKIFLSYHFDDIEFVAQVDYFLRTQPDLETYFWDADQRGFDFIEPLKDAVGESDAFAYFCGLARGDTQADELAEVHKWPTLHEHLLYVWLPGYEGFEGGGANPIRAERTDEAAAMGCAKSIVRALSRHWIPPDGIPDGYPFDHEKAIVEAHVSGDLDARKIRDGCPPDWPQVHKDAANIANPLPESTIGAYRSEAAEVLVDARLLHAYLGGDGEASSNVKRLTFPEAGPRKSLRFPTAGILRVGLLVSGGIAPGTNAIIQSIVGRHLQYQRASRHQYTLQMNGYLEGFRSLLDRGGSYLPLDSASISEIAHRGGSFLGTSRAPELLDENPRAREEHLGTMVGKLNNDGIDILYVIGGDGSMRAAHALQVTAWRLGSHLAVVAIPKTTDNDILWVWQSVGLTSAVAKASQCMLDLHVEIQSFPRLCVLQLVGSDSGFLIGNATLAAGENVCDAALIPEAPFSMKKLALYIRRRLGGRLQLGVVGKRPFGLVVMGETTLPTDFEDYLDAPYVELAGEEREAIRKFVRDGRRVFGPTPRALRTGVLKLLSRALEHHIHESGGSVDAANYWQSFSVFTNSPRNLIRAVPPDVPDVIVAQRLGTLAVDDAMAGYSDFMVSQWLTEYVLVPLRLVVLGRKRVWTDGIFWKWPPLRNEEPEPPWVSWCVA
jgi:6-phosphofructokinase 1